MWHWKCLWLDTSKATVLELPDPENREGDSLSEDSHCRLLISKELLTVPKLMEITQPYTANWTSDWLWLAGVHKLQKCRSHIKILRARRVTWSKVLTEDPKIFGANVQQFPGQPGTQNLCTPGLWNNGWQIMDHPLYSPYLAPSYFQQFEPLTKRSANSSWLQTIYTNLFCTRTQTLVPPCETCLNVIGDHVHVWCISSATYMPSTHQIRTLLGISVFVTLFLKLLWRLPCILRNNTDWLRRSTMLKCFIFLLTEWDWQQNIMV